MPELVFTFTLVFADWEFPIRWQHLRPLSIVPVKRSLPVVALCPIIMAWAKYEAIGIAMLSPRQDHLSTPPPNNILILATFSQREIYYPKRSRKS